MNSNDKDCLLIWPPFLTTSHLPLGIPFLTSYLRKNGAKEIEVADLNISYLKRLKLFFLLYSINKRYHGLVGKVNQASKTTSPTDIKSNQSFQKKALSLRKIIAFFPNHIIKSLNSLLESIKNNHKRSIPWSLEAIINTDLPNTHRAIKLRLFKSLVPLLKRNNYKLICISVIYPEQLLFALLIAGILKEISGAQTRIVLGGSQISKHIDRIKKSSKVYDLIDFFITDDGEEPLLRLLKALDDKDFQDVPNLYYKNSEKPGSYFEPKHFFRLSPENFPVPDFTGFDLSMYRNQLPILASKGCFWSKCNFCTYAGLHEKKFSMTSAEKIIETLKKTGDLYGIPSYKFVDDALPPKFMKDLASGILRDKLNIRWTCSIIISKEFANTDFCKRLKEAGLYQVSIGLESISPRILGLMNKCHKDINESDIAAIMSSLKTADINIGVHIIFGFPSETREEARKTLNFLVNNKNLYDMCMFQPFCLEDDTPVFANPERFGISKVHLQDKNSGERLGYRYEVTNGMDQEETLDFTYNEAITTFRRSRISAACSRKK